MILKLFILCLPSLFASLLPDNPEFSIAWSLAGSVFIASIAQTNWFRESTEAESVSDRLLRPVSMFHFMFVAYHVLGGALHALNGAGYSLFGTTTLDPRYDASVVAQCQRLMLLSHTSITIGMKFVGFRYGQPQFQFRSIPPYSLTLISILCLGINAVAGGFSVLQHFNSIIATISATAILVEVWMCIRHKRRTNLTVALVFLGANLFSSAVSGWKGRLLSTSIILCALLFRLMPRLVVLGGATVLLLWALYFYPFGLALRPLLWEEGVPRNLAVEMAINKTVDLSLDERLDILWSNLSDRLNDLGQFRRYVEYVPEVHPYYGITLLRDAGIALVPRVLWPEKPDMEILSMQRVIEAGVVTSRSVVSAKSNFYQDAYLSGGEIGIIVAGLFLGTVMMWLSRACERLFGGYEIGTCLVYTSLFSTLFHMAQNFEFFLGSLAMSLVFVLALFFLARSMGWIVPASDVNSSLEHSPSPAHAAKGWTAI